MPSACGIALIPWGVALVVTTPHICELPRALIWRSRELPRALIWRSRELPRAPIWKSSQLPERMGCSRCPAQEAIGFCLGSLVNDKDGVSASAVFGEMAAFLQRTHSRSITEHMEALYAHYGNFVQNNGYVICRHPPTTVKLFERLRNESRYWLLLDGIRITSVRDLTSGIDTEGPGGRATLPVSTSSQMITYTFADGAVATLRGSGTGRAVSEPRARESA